MKIRAFLNQKGQSSVEYILMILVVVFCATSVFKQLDKHIVSNPNSFINKYLSSYRSAFGGPDGGFTGAYRYFSIRR